MEEHIKKLKAKVEAAQALAEGFDKAKHILTLAEFDSAEILDALDALNETADAYVNEL